MRRADFIHKITWLFLAIGILASTAAIAVEPVILKVWQLPDARKTDPYAQADLAVLEAFRERFPHIELRDFSGIKIDGSESLDTGPLMAIAGGVSPDVIYVNFRQSDTYIQNNFLYPLDSFMADLSQEDLDLRVAKPVWPVIKRKGSDSIKRTWALPYGTLVRVLIYRKDLFRKAGLDPNKPPATWDELLDYSRRLTDPEAGTVGMKLARGDGAAYDWITFLWSAGGRAVKEMEDGDWKATFDSPAAIDAADFYLKLCTTPWRDAQGREQRGFVIRDGGTRVNKMWTDGKIGMRFTYMSERDMGGKQGSGIEGKALDPNLYGLAPVPLSWNGTRASELNCTMMGIFSKAGEENNAGLGPRDPDAVKRAAWDYIWFMDSEAARAIRIRVLVEAGFGKMQNPFYLERYGYSEYLKYIDPDIITTWREALENGIPEPYGRNCQRIYHFMSEPLERCVELATNNELGSSPEARLETISTVFKEGVARTNAKMIGRIAPEERARRNRLAGLVAVFIALVFAMVVYRVWKIFTPDAQPDKQGWMVGKYFYAYLLLVPALGSVILWNYVPMLMGSIMSFQNYQIVGESSWVGLENFADVLFDGEWWSAVGKTLLYMLLMLSLGFFPPIILAILLQEVSHGKVFYRVIFYLPAVITGVIVIYLWKLLYDPSDAGGLNQLLMSVGLEKQSWLEDKRLAMLCCIIPSVWAGVGPGCLIYLAALKSISDDSYEAADIDGASFIQKIRYVVFPGLKALIIIQFIAAFIIASQQTGFILVMTFGGPAGATQVAGLMIFETAYLSLKFGIATTMAWMLGIILMGFTVLQLRHLSRMEFRAQTDTGMESN